MVRYTVVELPRIRPTLTHTHIRRRRRSPVPPVGPLLAGHRKTIAITPTLELRLRYLGTGMTWAIIQSKVNIRSIARRTGGLCPSICPLQGRVAIRTLVIR